MAPSLPGHTVVNVSGPEAEVPLHGVGLDEVGRRVALFGAREREQEGRGGAFERSEGLDDERPGQRGGRQDDLASPEQDLLRRRP
eukprot:1707438-Rhodomonas_salina.2